MSNTISSELIPKIIGDANETMSETMALVARTNRMGQSKQGLMQGNVGKTLDVPIPPRLTAAARTAANTAPAPTDNTTTVAQVTISNSKQANFGFTTKELQDYVLGGPQSVLSMNIKEAVRAVIYDLNAALQARYYQIPYVVGTAGTGQFASSIDQLADVRKKLIDNRNRPEVFDIIVPTSDYAAALKLDTLQRVNEAGNSVARTRGILATTLGFDIYEDQQTPIHTTGTITTGLITKAATAVDAGTTSFIGTTAASTGACALKKGDVISIAHASGARTYAVQADVTQASAATDTAAITLDRGLEFALIGSEAVTLASGTSVVSIGGNMVGLTAVTRLPDDVLAENSMPGFVGTQGMKAAAIEPNSGVAVQLAIYPQFGQMRFEASLNYGVGVTDPRRLVRSQTTAS